MKGGCRRPCCRRCDLCTEFYVLVGTMQIHVVQANMRMKNGVVHVVDKVLFDPNDVNTGATTSGTVASVYSGVALFVPLSVFIACIARTW